MQSLNDARARIGMALLGRDDMDRVDVSAGDLRALLAFFEPAQQCSYCLGSGTTTKDASDGYLDCTACDAAEKRAAFEKWIRVQRPGGQFNTTNLARDWAIYKHVFALARGWEE